MQKTIYSPEHRLFLDLLKHCREAQGVTQTELASRLDWQQALVSRTERGARRIDVLELRRWLGALDIELAEFIAELEEVLQKNTPPGTRKPRKQKAS
ncbi:helix-turn-helix domain-containing protein [Burkholderiaceae bacterium UC74_6]